jgi:ribosomal protein S15P/S13E
MASTLPSARPCSIASRSADDRSGGFIFDGLGLARDAAQAERRRVHALVRDAVALEGLFLAMFDHRHAEHRRVLERAAHQQRRRHRPPIVGDGDTARFPELGQIGELLARLPARDRADRVDARETRLRGLAKNVGGDAGVVVHGRRVRHAGDGGEPAGHGRRRARRDRLLVLLPRLAQVHVHVDQARADHESRRDLDDLDALGRQVAPHARDPAAVHQHVEGAVAAVGRIHDAPALQQNHPSTSAPPASR